MTPTKSIAAVFHAGDELELVAGTYQGTRGTFVALAADPSWADIIESGGSLRRHPVAWMAHLPLKGSLLPRVPRVQDGV